MVELLKAKEIVERPETADRLRKCKDVMGTLYATDASDDYTFQNAYREFYDLEKTYSENFKTKFFYILEEMKDADSLSFRDALERLYEIETADELSLDRCNKRYDDFYDKFYVYLNSPEGDALVKVFDQKFPNAEISDVSKIEFIIWGDM